MRAIAKGPSRIVFLTVLLGVAAWLGPGLAGVRAVDDPGAMEDPCAGEMQWMLGWCMDTVPGVDAQGSGEVTALALQAQSASSTAEFTPIDIEDASGNLQPTRAFGINPQGSIVGSYTDASRRTHGYLLRNGVVTTIDYPDPDPDHGVKTTSTEAWGINARGDIIGRYTISGRPGVLGFLLRRGRFTDISIEGHVVTLPTKIGASGETVGCFHETSGFIDMFGYVQQGSEVTSFTLPSRVAGSRSAAMHNGITPGGRTVVGLAFEDGPPPPTKPTTAYGYVITDGVFTRLDFETPGFKSTFTQAWDVNPRGTIVGQYVGASGKTLGFYRHENGYVSIDVPGSLSTVARGINPEGHIVGVYVACRDTSPCAAKDQVAHGFLLRR